MKATTLRIVLALLVAGAFLLTFSSARDKIEQDLLVPLFGAKQAEALENYQEKYTPLQLIDLKIHGKLPALQVQFQPLDATPLTGDVPVEITPQQPTEKKVVPSSAEGSSEELLDQPTDK